MLIKIIPIKQWRFQPEIRFPATAYVIPGCKKTKKSQRSSLADLNVERLMIQILFQGLSNDFIQLFLQLF